MPRGKKYPSRRTRSASPPSAASGRKKPAGGETSAAERAYQLIRNRIITRAYAPGQFMHEMAICEDLGIGRTPVHQALHRLKLERFIAIIPRKGIMVETVSPSDIFTVLEVRELIEPYCAAQAASRVTDDLAQQLRKTLEIAQAAVAAKDQVRFMEMDQTFHGLVMFAAGNELLIDFLRSLHGRVARIWRAPAWSQQDYELTYEQHKDVVDAILRHDAAAASAAMRAHIISLRERVMQQFVNPQSELLRGNSDESVAVAGAVLSGRAGLL